MKPGTKVSVEYEYLDSKGVKWYGIKLVENGKTYTGKTVATDVELIPAPEIPTVKNGEDGITLSVTESDGATYQWQRKVVDADGKESWVDVKDGTGVLLKLPREADALRGVYRCVTTKGDITTASSPIRPVSDDWIAWLEAGEVTTEMIRRALNAGSLESVVVEEDNQLFYVRTGEALATYDPATGLLTDAHYRMPFARLVDGVIQPLTIDEIRAWAAEHREIAAAAAEMIFGKDADAN